MKPIIIKKGLRSEIADPELELYKVGEYLSYISAKMNFELSRAHLNIAIDRVYEIYSEAFLSAQVRAVDHLLIAHNTPDRIEFNKELLETITNAIGNKFDEQEYEILNYVLFPDRIFSNPNSYENYVSDVVVKVNNLEIEKFLSAQFYTFIDLQKTMRRELKFGTEHIYAGIDMQLEGLMDDIAGNIKLENRVSHKLCAIIMYLMNSDEAIGVRNSITNS